MCAHWYNSKGETAYEVKGANGKMRPSTLRDARKLNLSPSVTTIIGVANKEGLHTWKLQQLLNACAEWPYTDSQNIDEWKAGVSRISETISREAAVRGNEIHDKLEKVYKGELTLKLDQPDTGLLCATVAAVEEHIGVDLNWVAEESFSKFGYGGKIDLHAKDGKGVFLDFKTKNTDDPKKMKAYIEHAMQLAAYRAGLDLPEAVCYNVFISTKVPGLVLVHKWEEEELQRAYKMFNCLHDFWRLANKFEG